LAWAFCPPNGTDEKAHAIVIFGNGKDNQTMPKMKTSRSAAKRFKATATGKLRRRRAFHSHILTKKSPKRRRRLRSETEVSPADQKRIRRLLGQ